MRHILAMTLGVLLSAGAARAQNWEAAEAALNRGDYAAALKELYPLAEAGDDYAQGLLGLMYDRGDGVPQDKVEAVRWYRMAADQGNVVGQVSLGLMYLKGDGVPQDKVEAVRWYQMAADQGYAQAQTKLGAMYFLGEGVAQDYAAAHMHSNIGCALGVEDGCRLRDRIATYMTPEDISEAQRRARVCMKSDYKNCD